MKLDQQGFAQFSRAVTAAFRERFEPTSAKLFVGLTFADGQLALGIDGGDFERTVDALEQWIQLYRAGRAYKVEAPEANEVN